MRIISVIGEKNSKRFVFFLLMDSFISQIRDAAFEETDFEDFRDRMRKIDEKFVQVFFGRNFQNQPPEHAFRSVSFARPELTIEQRRSPIGRSRSPLSRR